jgi:hypothetical protein
MKYSPDVQREKSCGVGACWTRQRLVTGAATTAPIQTRAAAPCAQLDAGPYSPSKHSDGTRVILHILIRTCCRCTCAHVRRREHAVLTASRRLRLLQCACARTRHMQLCNRSDGTARQVLFRENMVNWSCDAGRPHDHCSGDSMPCPDKRRNRAAPLRCPPSTNANAL